MRFPKLYEGVLVKRYKRFLADIRLPTGTLITAHCANPGSMLEVAMEGARVWVANHEGTNRKLKWSWELIELTAFTPHTLLAVNTTNPNKLVAEALTKRMIPEFSLYDEIKPEQKYADKSRIDFLLKRQGHADCYLEVKNVHLRRRQDGLAEFPDSKTARGLKHLADLQAMKAQGHRAVLLFVIQRSDCKGLQPAADLDPAYASALEAAHQKGVEILVWDCEVAPNEVVLRKPLPLHLS